MHIQALASFFFLVAASASYLPLSPFPPDSTTSPRLLQFDRSHKFVARSQDTDQTLLSECSFPRHFQSTLSLKAVPTTVHRPNSHETLQQARWRSIQQAQNVPVQWTETQVLGPDVTDKHTLAQLARMAANAYQLPGKDNWYELDPSWSINSSFPFGWDNDEDGLRGFVFRSRDNSTVVLSIKVCNCYDWFGLHKRCDDPCLSAALIQDNLFYSTGVRLVTDLQFLFPRANIWLVGHSLGGSLASLLGSTFGLPAVAFEAPGERMAAHRLHLPLPLLPSGTGWPHVPVTHVYHNADPIPQGACTGITSLCAQAGYALETRCHLGQTIVYDTVTRLGWHADVRKHPIKELVLNVLELAGSWPDGQDGGEREVPTPREEANCIDCFQWEFGHFKYRT